MNERQTKQNQQEEREIDIFRLLQIILKRAWIIALATVVLTVSTYLYSAIFITPTYKASFTAYVNNRTATVQENNGTTVSDLNASIYLSYLYQEILVSRSVLSDAAEACDMEISAEALAGKVSTSTVKNAALLQVTVTDTDPARAAKLAAAIAEVAPRHVARVVDGSSMVVVDAPIQPTAKSAPHNTKNAMMGGIVGFVLSLVIVLVVDLTNDKVRGSEELEQRHGIVVIGTIPELSAGDGGSGNYGYGYGKAGKAK